MDLSNLSNHVFEAFALRREILLQNKIDAEMQIKVCRMILYLNTINPAPIKLYIDSPGGSTVFSLLIADAIRNSTAKIHGIVFGFAKSGAFWILQHCHKRLAYPHAEMMFHGTICEHRIDEDVDENNDRILKSYHSEQMTLYSKRSSLRLEECREWSKKQKNFFAPEAHNVGLIDEILTKDSWWENISPPNHNEQSLPL